MPSIAVIGATGDIGYSVVTEALTRGWEVIAVGRSPATLAGLADELSDSALRTIVGSVATDADASRLIATIDPATLDGVVTAVNGPKVFSPLVDWADTDLVEALRTDLLPHFVAARAFASALPREAVYVGVGGGMADLAIRGFGVSSMIQAAQRMMFRTLSKEQSEGQAQVRELIVAAMVNGRSNRATAPSDWLTAERVAHEVCEILTTPEARQGPVITLRG